jgi:serine/threonine-protein kinase RsbW
MGMTRTISLAIDSRPECIELLSHALYGLVRLTALPAVDIAKIELAMVEAVNNAVEHAYHGEPGHPVVVEFRLAPGGFSLLVCDRGEPMDPRKLTESTEFVEPDRADPETWRSRGRGLGIIKSCVDSVEYQVRDGVNTLIMNRALDGRKLGSG